MLGRLYDVVSGRGLGQKIPYASAFDTAFYRYRVHRRSPVETAWGDQLFLDSNDHIVSRFILDHSAFQPALTAFFQQHLKPGMTVIDVGAHIGYFTLLFAHLVGDEGTVVAFEPAPKNQVLLDRNVALNGYRTVETHRTAVADSPGTATLHLDARNTGHHSLVATDQDAGHATVKTVTLDAAVDGAVDVVKIDTEGGEPRILKGFEQILTTHHPIVILEYSRCWAQSLDDGLSVLRNAGYSLGYLDEEGLVRGLSGVHERENPVDIIAAYRWPPFSDI